MPNKGFTLVELLVVLAILGAITALAPFVLHKAVPSLEQRAAARDLAGALSSARSLALSQNAPTAVVIDVTDKSYAVEGRVSKTLPEALQVTLVTATSELEDEDRGRIVFYPDGTATGGEVRLASEEQTEVVVVDWLTARVTIEDGE